MRAIIYSRFSTDRQNETSIEDQVRVCTDYAVSKDWQIVGHHSDEGISGAALGNRPGINAILKAATEGRIDALLVRDVQRIARGEDLPVLAKRLKFHDVRLIGVLDGADSHAEGSRMRFGMEGIMGAEFIESVRRSTHSGLAMRAQNGNHTGGVAYGYDTIQDGLFFTRVIHPERAAIIREIFTRYANGETQKAIASDLNARGIPSPGANWKRKKRRTDGKWLVSGLHAILHNELYAGRLIWNRRKSVKHPDTGKRIFRDRPEAEWIVREVPELAIVDAETWARVRARDSAIAAYGKPNARPRYLLSGLLLCGCCGRAMTLVGGRGQRYVCGTRHAGGDAACSNALAVNRELAEEMILIPVKDRLLSTAAVQQAGRDIREILSGQREPAPSPTVLGGSTDADQAKVRELRQLVARGILSAQEAQPAIDRLLAIRPAPGRPGEADILKATEAFKTKAERAREALDGPVVAVAREALRGLVGAIRCVPTSDGGEPYLMAHFGDSETVYLNDWLSLGPDFAWSAIAESSMVAGACLPHILRYLGEKESSDSATPAAYRCPPCLRGAVSGGTSEKSSLVPVGMRKCTFFFSLNSLTRCPSAKENFWSMHSPFSATT